MDGLFASLSYWHHLLVAFSIAMGLEASVLLFVATLRGRRRYEQALALLPAGGFAVGIFLVRRAESTLSYVFFQQTHYPPRYWPAFEREQGPGLQSLANGLQQQATLIGVLTFTLLIGGGVLLLHWLPNPRYEAQPASFAPAMEPPTDDGLGTDDSLEITIEPIEPEKR